jgi:hypothetical protein
MTLSSLSDTTRSENEYFRCEPTSVSSTEMDEERIDLPEIRSGSETTIETINLFDFREQKMETGSCLDKLELPDFPIDRPWLPQSALTILSKLKKGPISEKELVKLMELVAHEATSHFRLESGKFVGLTFFGKVVEVSDTRVDLLRKIQKRNFPEQVFVWRVGFNSFSGRT